MKIYIAGKITGDDNYKNKFQKAQRRLEKMGHIVMNPAILPEGFEHEEYMKICKAMIDCCDSICLLPDWQDSNGACMEKLYAYEQKKGIGYFKYIDCYIIP